MQNITQQEAAKGMKNKMAHNISNMVVRSADGSVDFQATLAKFDADLKEYLLTAETLNDEIAVAVNQVFDENRGARLTIPVTLSFVLRNLNCSAEDWNTKSKLVHDYLTENTALFNIRKGKGGGCARVSDLPVAAE